MATDPERIETLEHERDRLERTWREKPKRGFGEVLSETPARDDDEREARAAAPDDDERDDMDEETALELPRVPPDPRMAKLHAMVPPKGPPGGRS